MLMAPSPKRPAENNLLLPNGCLRLVITELHLNVSDVLIPITFFTQLQSAPSSMVHILVKGIYPIHQLLKIL